jgi:hypothetical protein
MATMTVNRETRRRGFSGRGKRAGLLGAAAVTAAAMTFGAAASPLAPEANAISADVTTTGPLLWLAAQLGLNSVDIPVSGIGTITVNLHWTESDSVNLYDAVNAAPFGTNLGLGAIRPSLVDALSGTALAPMLIAAGTGTTGAIEAYKALYASASGATPEGYTPLTPHSGAGSNITNLPLIMIRNLGTPNGGFYTRFGQLFELFGENPTSPEGGSTTSPKIAFNSMIANIGIAYDSFSDFPVTANIFSIANSLLQGAIPSNLLSGITLKGAGVSDIESNLIGLLSFSTPSTSYSSILPTDFALLEPLRLPARLINLALSALGVDFKVPTLLADALTPVTKILVNIGYTDVVTPEMIANDPETYGDYQPYDRTFLDAGGDGGAPVSWLSQNPLTPSEWAALPQDLIGALIDGFFGWLTPDTAAPAAPAAALTPQAAAVAPPVAASDEVAADVAPAAENSPLSDNAGDDSDASPIKLDNRAGGPGAAAKDHGKSSSAASDSAGASAKDSSGSSRGGLGSSKRAKAADAA